MMQAQAKERRSKRRIIDFDIEIGRRLRAQRTVCRISQAELAQAIGLTFQQIQKYENGTNRISAGKLVQIAQYLEVPLAVFFEGLDRGVSDGGAKLADAEIQQLQTYAVSVEGRRLYRAIMRVDNPETRRLLVRMLESAVEKETS